MKKIFTQFRNRIAAAALVLLAAPSFAQTDVLVCGAASPQSWLDDVSNKLIATGAFNSVQNFNIYTGTPTLAYLQSFDAVLVYTDYSCADPTTLGNNLAAYIDGGGGVVNCVFSNASVPIGGTFNTAAYQVAIPAGQNASPELTLGTILQSCDPIMQGITSFDGGSSSYRTTSSSFTTGTQVVANWSNGEWLVADKLNVGPMSVRRADLNFYPPSSDVRGDFWNSSTQGAQIMANALLWVAGVTNPGNPPATPGTVTGAASICSGSTGTYSIAPVPFANSYTWNVPSGSTIQSGQGTTSITVLAGTTSGTITVTADNGCGSSTPSSFTLTINPLPTVGSTASAPGACPGGNMTLNGTGASSYTWSGGITDGVPFPVNATTTYTVTGTDGNGCVNTATHLITMYPLPTVTANSTAATVCSGSPVTLNGSGAVSYTWTGNVTDNVPFNPTSTGTYTVTGTDANGCQNTAFTTVNVNPLPNVSANNTSTCSGSQATLSGMGAVSYTWTGGVTDNVPFTPTSTSTYTVTGTDANGCQNTAVATVTVNPLPSVVGHATPSALVCNGATVTLYGSGAVTYTWTGGIQDSVAFLPATSGTYTVTGTDANGCVNTGEITITVNPAIAVTANASSTSVCAGTSVTLTGSSTSTLTYSWTGGVFNNVPFTPTSTVTYTVTGTDQNGCSDQDAVTVNVHQLPSVTATSTVTTVCLNDGAVTLSGTPANGAWSGAGVSGASFNPSVAGLGAHAATYSFTDSNGCTNSAAVNFTVNACTGIVESSLENSVLVYPNPNNGTFTVSVNANLSKLQLDMLDMQGRLVYAVSENDVNAGFSTQVSVNELPAGIYILRMSSNEGQRMVKVSVQK